MVYISDSDGKYKLAVNSVDEIAAEVFRATTIGGHQYWLVTLRRVKINIHMIKEHKIGEEYDCGIYREKSTATDELLRLWHLIQSDKHKIIKEVYFNFKKDPEGEITALEIARLLTAFI